MMPERSPPSVVDHGQEPRARHGDEGGRAFADRPRRQVANDAAEEQAGDEVDGAREEERAKAGDEPNRRSQNEPLREVASAFEAPAFRDHCREKPEKTFALFRPVRRRFLRQYRLLHCAVA